MSNFATISRQKRVQWQTMILHGMIIVSEDVPIERYLFGSQHQGTLTGGLSGVWNDVKFQANITLCKGFA